MSLVDLLAKAANSETLYRLLESRYEASYAPPKPPAEPEPTPTLIQPTGHQEKRICTCACHTRARKTSDFENGVMDRLRGHGMPIETQVKAHRWRFDAGITGHNILIEADGDFWHGNPTIQERDARKDQWCQENGYTLFRVTEQAFMDDPDAAIADIVAHWREVSANGK